MTVAIPAEGSSVADAEALYRQILADHPSAKHAVRDWGGAKLTDFCEPQGWLGLWMLKADIHSMVLFGCRLWDVVYQASDKAAEGVLPLDRHSMDLTASVQSSYDSIPVADNTNLTAALRFLLAQHGLNASILEHNAVVEPRPIELPGSTEEPLAVGDILPFPRLSVCIESLLTGFTNDVHRELVRIRAQRQRDFEAPIVQ